MMLIWRNCSLITSLSKTYKGYRFCLSKLGLFFWISLFYSTFKIQCSTFSNFRWNIYRSYSPFWCFVIKINICFVNRIYLKIILLIKETSCFIVFCCCCWATQYHRSSHQFLFCEIAVFLFLVKKLEGYV